MFSAVYWPKKPPSYSTATPGMELCSDSHSPLDPCVKAKVEAATGEGN